MNIFETMPAATSLLFRRIFKLSGKDAIPFINSLATNTLKSPVTYMLFLTPQSRVIADGFYYKGTKNDYLEVCDTLADKLLLHIQKYKLRSDVQLLPIHGQVQWHLNKVEMDDAIVVKDPRPYMGYRSLHIAKDAPVITSDAHDYTVFRYKYGIPEVSDKPGSIPFELNLDLLNSIDYSKGCYTGQELIIRTKHTGVVRRRAIPFKIKDVNNFKISDLKNEDIHIEQENIKIGNVICYVRSGHTVYGLAKVKIDHFNNDAFIKDIPITLSKPAYLHIG